MSRAPSSRMRAIVAGTTPTTSPCLPAWQPPITRASASANSTIAQSAPRTISVMPGWSVTTPSARAWR